MSAVPPARPGTHPVPNRRLPAALLTGRLAARTAPPGARTIHDQARTGSPQQIPPSKRTLLVTYRRDGRPVATPVWAAEDHGRFYVRSERAAGKVKRRRRDNRVLLAPCTVRGRPLGAPFEGHARVLTLDEAHRGERALARRYGLGRELFERAVDIMRIDMCYLEITPGAWEWGALPPGGPFSELYDPLTCPVSMAESRYDQIGAGYATTRREDPRIAARVHAVLGEARTVVNVGAGAGSYEPRDRQVIAVEPSEVMAAQRPPELSRAILAEAYPLPLADDSVDAAMALLAVHHWDSQQELGVRELRRVARGPVVILTFDPRVSARMWLMAEYLPEVAELDRRIFPLPEQLADWLGAGTAIETVPIARDTPDWTLGSFWAHPARVLDAPARTGTSGFARMPTEVMSWRPSAATSRTAPGISATGTYATSPTTTPGCAWSRTAPHNTATRSSVPDCAYPERPEPLARWP